MAGYDPVIPAGGSGKLTAKVKTHANQKGHLTKVVTVTTDDPVVKTIQLKMSFDVEPAIDIKPQARVYIKAMEGESGHGEVILHRMDGKPLQISKIETGGARFISAVTEKVEAKDPATGAVPGDVRVRITTKPLEGFLTRTENLVLHTNHPKVGTLKIPVTLRVRSAIEAIPGQVRMWLGPDEKKSGAKAVVVVKSTVGTPFAITAVESSDPDLLRVTPDGKDRAVQHTVSVQIPQEKAASIGKGTKRATITVKTDSERKPLLEIPVFISERRVPSRGPVGLSMERTRIPVERGGLQSIQSPGKMVRPVPGGAMRPVPVQPTATPSSGGGGN